MLTNIGMNKCLYINLIVYIHRNKAEQIAPTHNKLDESHRFTDKQMKRGTEEHIFY